jgi:hypothetical protein
MYGTQSETSTYLGSKVPDITSLIQGAGFDKEARFHSVSLLLYTDSKSQNGQYSMFGSGRGNGE